MAETTAATRSRVRPAPSGRWPRSCSSPPTCSACTSTWAAATTCSTPSGSTSASTRRCSALCLRRRTRSCRASRKSAKRWLVPFILITGVLFRLAVLPAPPSLSTDIYRYVWDGRLTTARHQPLPLDAQLPDPAFPARPHLGEDGVQAVPDHLYAGVAGFFALGNAAFGENLDRLQGPVHRCSTAA